MPICRVRITDDGGPIVGRLAVLLPDDAFGVIKIGDVELRIAGVGDECAERCRMLAGEFERLRLELLNAGRPSSYLDLADPAACPGDSPPWFTGRWRDWHRGHGCEKDDGRPRAPEAIDEIARHEAQS